MHKLQVLLIKLFFDNSRFKLSLGQNPRLFIQHIQFVKLNSSYETGLTISRLFLPRFSKNSLSKTLNLYRRINELALTSSNQRINNYELNSSELNAKGMYETGLKLKYCAGSVMPRCVLTVLSNGFKKPVFFGVFRTVFSFLPEPPHPTCKCIHCTCKYIVSSLFTATVCFFIFKIVTRNLNKIIDINYYPVPEVLYLIFACLFIPCPSYQSIISIMLVNYTAVLNVEY